MAARRPRYPLAALKRLIREFSRCGISVHAGNAVFFLVLSVFPLLSLTLGMLPFLPIGEGDILRAMEQAMPKETADFLRQLIRANDPIAVISVSALTAMWSASRGTYGILLGLNRAYGLRETRSWLRIRVGCVLDTLLVLTAVLLSVSILLRPGKPVFSGRVLPILLRTACLTLFLMLIHRTFPDHRTNRPPILPGSLLTALAWQLFSSGYACYVRSFGGAGRFYGSLSSAAVTLLWLYFCVELLFLGAVLNRLLSQRTNPQDG